jgi:xanthine dehydrogenase accessory factor
MEGLKRNYSVALLYVVESIGSSPGREGFCMAVLEDGDMTGSIGGGIMEHKLVELARSLLSGEIAPPRLVRQLHSKSAPADQSGMICSGEQTVAICILSAADLPILENCLKGKGYSKNTARLQISDKGIGLSEPENEKSGLHKLSDTHWTYFESTARKSRIHLIGGGHCALALSQILAALEMEIWLYEERKNLHTVLLNQFAYKVIEVETYSALENILPADPDAFVVIMTIGYRTDGVAIRAIRNREFAWIGLLGSKAKIQKMEQDLCGGTVNYDWWKKVSAPVGLPINSRTPMEIAISIAAEIISVRNNQKFRIENSK